MAEIFVGIPRIRQYKPFQESLSTFLDKIKGYHDIEVYEVRGLKRDEAREDITKKFLESNKKYLLFLDDDHSGHTPEMLEALLKPNAMFCSIKCYARYYPYQITTCSADDKYQDRNSLYVKGTKSGYSNCHFAGFGMAIIKRELFDSIPKPYFKCDRMGEKEDNYFCNKLIENGIYPLGCFDYTLDHYGINEETILRYRQDGLKDFIFKQNQKTRLKNIQECIKKRGITLNSDQEGKLQLMDVLLNNDIVLVNGEE